eukprot:TRINITY_DN1916_c0_g1_i1.p1 TRINITY_DN1916_c0_g1~~TRINITY_DN1916_c0_g1_i1.p1  ORF type:complete len:442 (-),score=138.40 TRINITY_DN1916_c0_g1_i1:1609-2934(-)
MPFIFLQAQKISKDAAIKAKAYSKAFLADMKATYAADLRVPDCDCLKYRGSSADVQMHNFFRKCVTPGAVINVGILGGSISQFGYGYQATFIKQLAEMCPSAEVKLYNGARSSTPSMTLGYCAVTAMGGPSELDLFISEFTYNDGVKYTTDGAFSSLPYELMLRSVLTAFPYSPSVLTLHFWGLDFTHKTPQAALVKLARRYKVSALSIRDVIWPYYTAGRDPYGSKDKCTIDGRHPSHAVHQLTADLLQTHFVTWFLAWVDSAIDGTASATAGKRVVALPEAEHAHLNTYKLNEAKMDCAIVPIIDRDNGVAPTLLPGSAGFVVKEEKLFSCVAFSSAAPRATVEVTTQTGRIFISNCNFALAATERVNGAEAAAAVSLYRVTAKGKWLPLALRQLVAEIPEGFEVKPPLDPGTYTIGITKNPSCAGAACTHGFVAIGGL